MGHVYVDVIVQGRKAKKARMMVDTGATFAMIPPSLAREIDLPPPHLKKKVHLAHGKAVELPFTVIGIKIDGHDSAATAIIGDCPIPLLGVETLEGLGLAVDPKRGRLIPSRPFGAHLGLAPSRPRRRHSKK